ncbi:MAG: ParB/RepB/Spo0J family partition protein [Bacteroidota bacterium]
MNTKNKGLGRGLSSLLQSGEEIDAAIEASIANRSAEIFCEISIQQIVTNPFQPRTSFEETSLKELSESITKQGIIQPITVRKIEKDKFQLISGERRFRASQLAGLEKIPAYIRLADDVQMLELALVENIQRENLNPIEIAITFQRLIDECSLTQEQLSERVGKNRSTVTNFIRLLKLPAEIQIAVRDGGISMGHARALITVDSTDKQIKLLHTILQKSLSVRQVEELVKSSNKPQPAASKTKHNILPEKIEKARSNISSKIISPIIIKRNLKGKGQIAIPFKSDAELERIINILAQ